MFQQLDVHNNVNQSGLGFGLTISKMLAEELGGTLEISNNKDNPEHKQLIQAFTNIQEKSLFES